MSSMDTAVLDSTLKKAIPLSGFSFSNSNPWRNQVSSWLMVMRPKTSFRLFKKKGTDSGDVASRVSHRSRM